MKGITIGEMKIGDSASFTKTITETDVYLYAGISGDFNPAHVNQTEAEKGMFGKRIAHGMLSAGLISAVLGTLLPGPGTICGTLLVPPPPSPPPPLPPPSPGLMLA